MIIQRRADSVRLITQHDHGLHCGALARAWRGGAGAALGFEAVFAVAVHDQAWREADAWAWSEDAEAAARAVCFDGARGAPRDFASLPLDDRVALYSDGLDEAETLDPLAGLLTSRHYAAFIPQEKARAFHAAEQARQRRLRGVLGRGEEEDAQEQGWLEVLRLLDALSLRVCVTAPGSQAERWPSWLQGPLRGAGQTLEARWLDAATLGVEPFPFAAPVTHRLRVRDVPGGPWEDVGAFARALASAPASWWTARVAPAR